MAAPLDVIAVQQFDLDAGGGVAPVVAQLGRPRRDSEPGGPWVCPVRVESPARVLEREGVGGTAFEALRVALQMLRQELVADLPRLTGGRVTGAGQPADWWFPNQFPLPPEAQHR